MKIRLIIIFLFIGNLVCAQSKFELSFSISNQGQIDRLLEDFYIPAHPTAYMDDSHRGKDLRIKYNFNASYLLRDSFEIRLRVGYAIRKNHYEQEFPTTSWIIDDKQNVFEVTPSFGFSKKLGRFSLSTGLEIPIYIVGDLNEKIDYREYSDSENLSFAYISDLAMDGGYAFGLNHYLKIKTHLTKHIFMFSELNYGLLYAKLGGKYQEYGESIYPIVSEDYFEFDKSYSKVYFSPIQVQFGIGWQF